MVFALKSSKRSPPSSTPPSPAISKIQSPVCHANLNCSYHGTPDFAIWVVDKETDAPRDSPRHKDDQIKTLKAEIERLRDGEAELRNVAEEREARIEDLEREVKELRQGNTEKEMKVRELERMLGVVQMTEVEERSKRVRAVARDNTRDSPVSAIVFSSLC